MMKKRLLIFTVLLGLGFNSYCQVLSTATTEGVYGGTVKNMATWQFDTDSAYIVVSTESPNSIFYAKAYRGTGSIENFDWQVLPSAGADDGFGDQVNTLDVHGNSNSIFFLHQGDLYKTNTTATTATKVDSLVKNFIVKGDTMILLKNNLLPSGNDTLVFGSLNSLGNFTDLGGIDLLKTYNDPPQLEINPFNKQLYILDRGASPHLYSIMDPYDALSSSSPLSSVMNPSPTISGIEWMTIGFADDGTWYLAGQPDLANPTSQDRKIAWTNDNGFSWNYLDMDVPGPQGGVVGSNFVINDTLNFRSIMIGNALLKDTTSMGVWNNIGVEYIGNLNRADDGKTIEDLFFEDMKYHSTNIGFGYSREYGDSIFGWNTGLEAVQVNDIEMTDDYLIGWVASKSGIRKVENYNTSSEVWANPIFPNFDGAPYEAVAIDKNDADTVFLGNQRVYRTINGGVPTGMTDGWEQVFSPEHAPYNFNSINSVCSSIDICRTNSEIIAASFVGTYGQKGGVFYSMDGGDTWQQMYILTSTDGQDVNVLDVQFTYENSKIVLYMAIESDVLTSGAYGLYRTEFDGTSWSTPVQDGSYGATDSVVDLELSKSHDSLVVLNVDPGLLPVNNVQVKDLASGIWNSTFGPYGIGGSASAITIGDGVIFIAINEEIHAISADFTSGWSPAYSYPVGTEINVLFYDELLVGTGTGLYAHDLDKSTLVRKEIEMNKSNFIVYPNPVEDVLHLTKKSNFEIYDLNGVKVLDASSKKTNKANVENLSSGIYILKSQDGQVIKFNKR